MHDVSVPNLAQYCYLIFHSEDILGSHAFFVNQFYGYFLVCWKMHCEVDFAKGTLTDIFTCFKKDFTKKIVPNNFGVRGKLAAINWRRVGRDCCV